MRKLILFLAILLFLALPSLSQPELFDSSPKNGSYIYGRDTDVFSIKSNSQPISASLFARVKDPTSVWKEISMNCYNLGYWLCNATIPGLEALLAEGKYLLFYFKVSDSSGTSYHGNESFPLEVLVDRSPPIVNLAFPYSNFTYVSERKKLSFIINDTLSGVNVESVMILFSYVNETRNSSWMKMIYDNVTQTFIAPWNTSELPNNSSWIVYVNASDNVGNWNVTKFGPFFIDNENPKILDYYPKENEGIWGGAEIFVKAFDGYSGLNRLEVSISSFKDFSYFQNDTARYILNTLEFSDGNYTLNLTVFDNAENFESILIPVRIDNTYPVLSLEYPSNYLSKEVALVLKVGNVKAINESKIIIKTQTWQSESPLECSNFTCVYRVDTKAYPDGIYNLIFSVKNEVGYEANYSKTFIFDNTLPVVIGDAVYANQTVKFSVGIIDENGIDINSTKIEAFDQTFYPSCKLFTEGKRALCELEINKSLSEGNYTVKFYAYDLANNENIDVKTLQVKFLYVEKNESQSLENVNASKSKEKEGFKLKLPFGELQPYQVGLLISIPLLAFSLPFILPLFSKQKQVIVSLKISEQLKKDLDTISMALKILGMKGENLLEEKEFLLNARKIIEGISETSSLKQSYEKILEIAPKILEQKLIEEYSPIVKKLEKRDFLEKAKKEIDFALSLNDIESLRNIKEKVKILLQEGKKHIEEEINVSLELEKIIGEKA